MLPAAARSPADCLFITKALTTRYDDVASGGELVVDIEIFPYVAGGERLSMQRVASSAPSSWAPIRVGKSSAPVGWEMRERVGSFRAAISPRSPRPGGRSNGITGVRTRLPRVLSGKFARPRTRQRKV